MNVAIIGASGYSGAELASLVAKHPNLTLSGCYVSEGSLDKHKLLSDLYPEHRNLLDIPLLPLSESAFDDINSSADYICLCTDHKVSVDLAPQFLAMGKKVFDLSGGYRLASNDDYVTYYGFEHQHPELLNEAAYGLAEWNSSAIAKANLVAVAGCYPTAALNALKPLQQAGLLSDEKVIINAVSGVTGAGRKASVGTHFCEVSLAPYGLFNHRHGPEIEQHLGHKVLFTPHLGNFPRGILETIYVQLKPGVTKENVSDAYQVLKNEPLIRLLADKVPSIKSVVKQPYVDIGWQQQGTQLIVIASIDNLLKGAAGQALQCINLSMNLDHTTGLKGAF
ncbi:N-acetyl-gamma-glutamyl-phosphate reductase [Pseudoalteromonas agarivorans]|uniref:N-acetyl-gamma-glutamyl-phosphate reductase n=1 Tax=Pseudoalteromonas agarivorans TaxID=176102 RepID=UPI002118F4CC|nr:N-acetyl-gamma-glutamyl-phosphate reductase [Pseudoalteromonas agarivorans]MCQ8885528.1 N-acetyl-gamma-glutamyl-phosphate reductase [Pseudoalteromonas agarivorans]